MKVFFKVISVVFLIFFKISLAFFFLPVCSLCLVFLFFGFLIDCIASLRDSYNDELSSGQREMRKTDRQNERLHSFLNFIVEYWKFIFKWD